MLIVYQIPFCDARIFNPGEGLRLAIPDWQLPQPGTDFIRCFGPVKRRRRGGMDLFPDEAFYSEARRAVKLALPKHYRLGMPQAQVKPFGRFRRFFANGSPLTRFELGMVAEPAPERISPDGLDGREITAIILGLLELPVSVTQLGGEAIACPLWQADKSLARLYAKSTTHTKDFKDIDDRFVSAGEPQILIEYTGNELAKLPYSSREVNPKDLGGAELSYLWLEYRHRTYGVWFLNKFSANPDLVRRLRLGLLRLHAEHQVLKRILALITQGILEYTPGTKEADAFDEYFNDATRLLLKNERGGLSQTAIRDGIGSFQQIVNPEEWALLGNKIEKVRTQVRRKVENYAGKSAQAGAAGTGIASPAREIGDTVSVFVSYSPQDAKYLAVDSLLGYLRGLEGEKFDFWYDERIQTGELWDDRIRTEIDRADIALILISQAFLNSSYCQRVEIQGFLNNARTRGLKIYPIVLSPCDWQSHGWLKTTQFQPRNGQTIETDFDSPGKSKDLYLKILQELREFGKSVRDSRA